jgi:hypothetical protein
LTVLDEEAGQEWSYDLSHGLDRLREAEYAALFVFAGPDRD